MELVPRSSGEPLEKDGHLGDLGERGGTRERERGREGEGERERVEREGRVEAEAAAAEVDCSHASSAKSAVAKQA